MRTEAKFPELTVGVKISAALLVIYGAVIGMAAATGAVALVTLGLKRHGGTSAYPWAGFLSYCAVLALFACACLWAAFGLYQLNTRARRVGVGLGLFFLVFGIWILAAVYSPPGPAKFQGDGAEAILLTPFLILPGAWLSVYLSLPRATQQFAVIQK